jgi:uncharacterized phage protein gp47/JayE
MSYLLADLLSPQNLDTIRSLYLSALQGAGFPAITEWLPKAGVEMAYIDMVSRAIDEMIAADIPAIAASGFLGQATGDFMTLLAKEVYLLDRIEPTSTTFNMQFSSSAAAPPYNLAIGDIIVAAPTGNRYHNTIPVVIQPGTLSDAVSFQAEHPGAAFADNPTPGIPGAATMQLVTAFAGLTPVAASADFGPVVQSGSSTGQISAARSGLAAPDPHRYVLRIDIAGQLGAAQFSVSTDAGVFVAHGLLLASNDLGGGAKALAIAGGVTPSFIAGDTFTIISPGGPNFIQGSDEETDANLAARCRARWPALSLNATQAVIYLWARLAYPPASRIAVTPDPVIAGQIDVVVADSHGPIDPTNAQAIETYIAHRLSLLDSVRVQPASAQLVFAVATVTVTGATIAAVQQAAEEGWVLFLGAVPLGGIVRLSDLERVIMDAGAVDVDLSSIALNGHSANLQLGPGAVPQPGLALTVSLEWRIV